MKKKIMTGLVALLLLVTSITMTSCAGLQDSLQYYQSMTESSGSLFGSSNSSGGSTAYVPPSGDTYNNTIIIEGGSGTDISFAAAAGLRSSVSVWCSFPSSGSIFGSINSSAGSGVIYSLDAEKGSAFIITNFHVVYNKNSSSKISEDIKIYLYGMENADYAIPATYVGGSMYYDIAVLRIESNYLLQQSAKRGSVCAATFANSDSVTVGQTAIAIGNPEAYGISVTTGIVSVDSEYIPMTASDGVSRVELRVIRIDSAVNSGNSGGGLFNGKGEIIGIVNAKIMSSDVENIGFAIPSNVARAIADNIIDYCYGKECKTVMRGLMGITLALRSAYTEYDTETGALVRFEEIGVAKIEEDGLAKGVLEVGDIIKSVSVGERTVTVTRQHHLIDFMLDVRVGDTVNITVLRNGAEITLSTVITEDCLAAY